MIGKIKNILPNKKTILGLIAFLLIFYLLVILVGSGVLFTKEGLVYFILLIACFAVGAYPISKLLKERKENKKITDVINDPEKLFEALKKNGTMIDDGKEIDINLKEDPDNPGKKILEIKHGKVIRQEWRKKYETRPKQKENTNLQGQQKIQNGPIHGQPKHLNTSSSTSLNGNEKGNNNTGSKS